MALMLIIPEPSGVGTHLIEISKDSAFMRNIGQTIGREKLSRLEDCENGKGKRRRERKRERVSDCLFVIHL